ncbi:hypothetical protein [Winogradskya humida]|uniref:Uncharacterized protein n=1 Tax=Winogradskya humida TaxID=113566 RepID=A0ABQ3ZY97_9ACTN|nr:hypothetical protein [Actinoplanes humidus]GIE23523.1 hypothetical protein Ahu01nite_066250 [Actinoplanes humidus]
MPENESAPEDVSAQENGSVPEGDGEPEPAVFTNRAARRAKGKGGVKPEVFAKGQPPVGRGAVQSPRQYGNRRSG